MEKQQKLKLLLTSLRKKLGDNARLVINKKYSMDAYGSRLSKIFCKIEKYEDTRT